MFPHSLPAGQALTRTHPQALQVTAEARALHVNEGLGEKHEGDVRHQQPGSRYPEVQGFCLRDGGSIPHYCVLVDHPPKSLCPRGYPPACHAWRRVLVVLGGQVVQGVPLVPHLGHPSTERVQFASAAKSMARGRGGSSVCRPPPQAPALTFSPFRPGSPGVPGNPWGPISPCKAEGWGVSGWQGKGMAGTHHPPPPHPTYRFAVLARIALGMAERGEVSVQAGRQR